MENANQIEKKMILNIVEKQMEIVMNALMVLI